MQQAISFEAAWAQLKPVVTSILCNDKTSIDTTRWMHTYDLVFKLVSKSQERCNDLYNAVVALFKARAIALVEQARTLSDEDVMRFFSENWNRWCKSAKIISHMFMYLERTWINKRKTNVDNSIVRIQVKADEVWRETLFVVGLKEKLCPAMLNLIQEERDGGVIQQHLIRNCVDCLKKMDDVNRSNQLVTYRQHFEVYFLQRTKDYYVNESANVLKSGNPSEYMVFVDNKIKEEQARIKAYLDESTRKPLMELLDTVLLQGHAESFQTLFKASLASSSFDDSACLYRLLRRINATEPLAELFESHIMEYGQAQLEAVKEEMKSNPRVFIDTLLSIYHRYSQIVATGFQNNKDFMIAVDSCFSKFMTHSSLASGKTSASSMAALLLAKYCDSFLRRGSQVEESSIEGLENDVVALFRYLSDKDVFMQFFTKMMAKRFINNLSAGEEREVAMVTKLKSIQGSEFTTKASRMIAEVNVNEQINSDFQTYLSTKRVKLPFSVSMMVFSSGCWPVNSPQFSIDLPPEIDNVMKIITVFYARKHKERKLIHAVSLSHAEVSFATAKAKYQLSVTAFQMVILVFVSTRPSVTLKELSTETQIPNETLRQQLSTIVRSHVFSCSDGSDNSAWKEETVFSLNPKFAFKRAKLSLMSTGGSSGKRSEGRKPASAADGDQEEMEDVLSDRGIKLQAAVVRIMKSRRVLPYNSLVNEVIEQVQRWFMPQISMIKKAIESLIDQGYIRKSSQSRTFEYCG